MCVGLTGLRSVGAAGIPPKPTTEGIKMTLPPSTQECCWTSRTDGGHNTGCARYEFGERNLKRTEGRKRMLHYVFTTAFEGGIGYWSVTDEYHWAKPANSNQPTAPVNPHATEDDLDYFYAVIVSNEDDWGVEQAFVSETGEVQPITETQTLRIDIDVIERGMNLLVDKVIEATKSEDPKVPFSNPYLRQMVVQWLTDMEDGDSDVDGCDFVVQLGLFGEVVYS